MNGVQLEKVFKGLANRRRLAVIRLLSKKKELRVAEIAREIHLSFTSTSRHLVYLHRLDILDRRQEGLVAYYRLAGDMPLVVKGALIIIANSRE